MQPNDVYTAAAGAAQQEAQWQGAAERLDRVLPQLGLVRSRSRATELIANGGAVVDGVVVTKAGFKVAPGARVTAVGEDHYVSRAAHKLLAGLDRFDIDPAGRLAIDVGASTGGFTQVLLERGASTVLAIDVGHDQMAAELREHPGVRLFEGCNARDLTPELLASGTGVTELPSLVVADLSFISLTLVLPAMVRTATADAEFVLLIKPQFEVGRVSDGVVTDPGLRAEAMRIVLRAAAENGLAVRGLAPSPIAGGNGNVEYLACFVRGGADGGADPEHAERAAATAATLAAWEPSIIELAAAHGVTASPVGRAHTNLSHEPEGL